MENCYFAPGDSFSPLTPGKWKYYLSIAKEELITEEQIEGYWIGKGAERLGLKRNVKKQHFKNVFEGFAPQNRGIKLVKNAGNLDRQAAWDLMFAAPKSVAIAYSQLPSEAREKQIIYECHHKGVEKSIAFLTEHTTTRRFETGKGFSEEKADLVIAAFTHQTSRLNDPLIHTHAVVINLCYRDDCSTGSINSHQLYVLQKEAGTLYRAELAAQLEARLGVELKRKSSWFEIAGIPEEAINYFSKRRNEIEARLDLLGYHSAQAKEYASLDTRREKEYKSRIELQMDWKEQGQALGLSEKYVLNLLHKQIKRDSTEQIQILVNDVSQKLSELNRLFSDRDVLRLVAEEAQCRGIGIEEARAIAKAYLASDDLIEVKKFQKSQLYESNRSPLLLLPVAEEKKKIILITQPSKEPKATPEPQQVLQRSFG